MKKYDLDNFFIGKLYLLNTMPEKDNDLINEEIKYNNKYVELVACGAKPLNEKFIECRKDLYKKNKEYRGLLTSFYKVSDDELLCLHDNEICSNNKNYVKIFDLEPVSKFLNIDNIDIVKKEIKTRPNFIFDSLISKISSEDLLSLYSNCNDKEYVDKLFIGDLFLKKDDTTTKGLARKFILDKQGIKVCEDNKIFQSYKCLFFKSFFHGGILNLNTNQIFSADGVSKDDESHYDFIMPYNEYIKKSKKDVTLKKSLKNFYNNN